MSWRKTFSLLGVLVLLASAVPLSTMAAPASQDALGKIEALVLEEINAAGQTDYFVWLTEQADVSYADQLPTKVQKGTYVYETLRATADRTQAPLRRYLDQQGVSYQSYYIANAILVHGGSYGLLLALAIRPDVAQITANHQFQLEEPIKGPDQGQIEAVEPNITFVKAPDVWAMGFTGQGTVMAGNDTGLDWDHPAIINKYRGWNGSVADHNYNWWDATGAYPTVPGDGHGHGTHTTGTMVGDDGAGNQIGMAPGAQTVHCKNMTDGGSGSDSTFLTCFEWDLAPWDLNHANPLPAMAPDAINNSWGYGGGNQNQFRTAINNLQAAGIAVEVSAGNEGSGCSSLRSPGDYHEVLTTGSVNHASAFPGSMTGFSSRGPSDLDGNYFPDITAPGENIRSSVPGGTYQGGWSGTSMSGPHATALIGLMWSACPSFQGRVAETFALITSTAVPVTSYVGSCGGDYTTGPNNDWGYGTIDSLAAVQAVLGQCGPTGSLHGFIYDDTTLLPIQGAEVTAASLGGYAWTDTTDATGYYSFSIVPEDTYTVTAEHVMYTAAFTTGVQVVSGTVAQADLYLQPRGWLYGYVTDFDNSFPLDGATVTADDGTTTTTGPDGYYEMYLDEGTQDVTAAMPDYAPDTQAVTIVSGQGTQQDFALVAAIAFLPSPLHVYVDWQATYNEGATLTNRMPTPYDYEFGEEEGGFVPNLLGSTQVTIPAGPDKAPAGTVVGSGPYTPRVEATYTQPRYARPEAPLNVMLLAADDDNGYGSPIQTMLQAYGDLGAIVLYDPRSATPTLPELQAYDVVVVWSNYTFADATAIGNVLADYVDAGGRVVDLNFAIDTSWGMQGRFVTENYTAIVHGSTLYSSACLGTYDPTHPIMSDPDPVSNVCEPYYRIGSGSVTPGSTAIAWWNDGNVYVAAKDDHTVVSINGYVGYYYNWTGQQDDVLHNAILWMAVSPNVPWFGQAPVSGTVPAGGTVYPTMLFTATTAAGINQPGDYWCTLNVDGDPSLAVHVTMTVEPAANMGRVHGYVVDHCTGAPVGEVLVDITGGDPITQTLTDPSGYYTAWLYAGTYPVEFSAPDYLPYNTNVTIVGGGDVVLDVDFFPDRPCMVVEPATMSETLSWGDSATNPLTITNDGAVDLEFELVEQDRGWVPLVRIGTPVTPVKPLPVVDNPGSTSLAGRSNGTSGMPEAWAQGAPQPNALVRYAHIQCAGDTNSFYTVGGVSNGSIVNYTSRYDADTNTWTALAASPVGQEGPSGVCYQGKLYVVEGGGMTSFYIYDIASNTWTNGPAAPRGGWGAAMAAWNGKVYFIGGDSDFSPGNGVSDEVNIFDVAANTWIANGAAMPFGVNAAGYIQLGEYLYVAGGWWSGTPGNNSNYLQRYDIEGNAWETADFPMALADGPLAATSAYLYAIAGDASGGGYWDSQTAVYTYDFASFPGGTWMDITDPIGTALQGQRGGYCTDSIAGGEVWSSGGLNGPSFAWSPANQYRASEPCWTAVAPDVPWLFEAPVSGTVAPANSVVVDVTMDSTYVAQPGIYWATLKVKSNDPENSSFPVIVTMTVQPSPDMGRLSGVVYDNCTNETIAEALVTIVNGVPITQTETDGNGSYAAWLISGTYDVVYSADGYLDYSTSVDVVAGEVTSLDVWLVPDRPCIAIDPNAFEVWVVTGTAVYQDANGLDIIDNGGQDLDYELQERPGGYLPPLGEGLLVFTPLNGSSTQVPAVPLTAVGPTQSLATPVPSARPEDILWDQPLSSANQNAYVDQDFPDAAAYSSYLADDFINDNPWQITNIFVPGNGWNGFSTLMNATALVWAVYADNGGVPDGYPGGGNPPVWSISLAPNDPQVVITTGSGGMPSNATLNLTAPASIDAGHWWFIFYPVMNFSGGGQYGRQPADTTNGYTGQFINPGGGFGYGTNWQPWTIIGADRPDQAFRLEGFAGSQDVPWLWEEPITGTVPAQGTENVDIFFTALNTDTTPMALGTYTATLRVQNSDPVAGTLNVPVTMHIIDQFISPTASFDTNAPVCEGMPVEFTDTSDPGVPALIEWLWDFGDGNTSTDQHPTHLYAAPGTYTVTLTITQAQTGWTSSATAQVEVRPFPAAGFTFAVDELVVTFTDTSMNALSYMWDLGDGITDTVANPVHTYAAAGTYTVTQYVYNDCGMDMMVEWVTVGIAPDAAFLHNAPVCLGEVVTFTNGTVGTEPIWYSWDLGDGGTSTETNPVYLYAAAGLYTVTLDATNDFGTSQAEGVIEVLALPMAAFTYTLNGLEVTFANLSAGAASYLWAFGDGITDTVANPVHTYANAGTYDVGLDITGPCGTDTVTLQVTVAPTGYRLYLPLIIKMQAP